MVEAAAGAATPPVGELTDHVPDPAPAGSRVLLTDHPWPDAVVESAICASAGYELVDASPGQDPAAIRELAAGAVGILTNWVPVTAALIEDTLSLRVVSRLGVGVDNIDVAAATAHGVVVTRVPDYCVEEVSDHAVALVFAWARQVPFFDREVRAGRWEPGARTLRRVRDLVVGVWGTGRNGLATARKMASVGCTVLVDDRHPELAGCHRAVPVGELLERSDVVTLHLPLTPETDGIVGPAMLARMREGSLLVNTGRGRLVDAHALAAALDTGRPSAAALDVLPSEPAVPAVLAGRDDVILTPHVAFSSVQAVAEVRRRATEDLVRVLRGGRPLDPYPPSPPAAG